jgi:hypothetical protein
VCVFVFRCIGLRGGGLARWRVPRPFGWSVCVLCLCVLQGGDRATTPGSHSADDAQTLLDVGRMALERRGNSVAAHVTPGCSSGTTQQWCGEFALEEGQEVVSLCSRH